MSRFLVVPDHSAWVPILPRERCEVRKIEEDEEEGEAWKSEQKSLSIEDLLKREQAPTG